ncbi:hypothetical protein IU510_11565 [Nocardia cyriacigeorgica]|nr:hypothetical protein [Nocardia cyriacigeorgica]MBF6098716.1 hypothetical protein [Nocardia cyriacigeorgica]MBF6163037.1 hypothetical protein [Nocardia cyriacigeorgica]MBF6202005.1 hypothetical protein [Nocardia cyriacigeorgica]
MSSNSEGEYVAGESTALTMDHPVVRALTAQAPVGWERLDAVFVMTVSDHIASIVYSDRSRVKPVEPSELVVEAVRDLRAKTAAGSGDLWWRMSLALTSAGICEVDYDYGADPFPECRLLAPQAYAADLAAFPRARIPLWLSAYLRHDDRQRRTAHQAVRQARRDRVAEVWPVLAEKEFPPFPVLWARWATIAAAFTAVRSEWGPRMAPWTALFEGASGAGATLCALPHRRAVLSGGVPDAPALAVAYNEGAAMPDLYAGAPDWVADPVLNQRAADGLLSFCYWWDAGRWYRGQSPPAKDCAQALPGVWTAETVRDLVTELIVDAGGHVREQAAAALVSAAEAGKVTPALLMEVFGDGERFDADGAWHQYTLAGVVATAPEEQMPAERALKLVREYITGRGLDTTGYPLAELVAERFSVGWLVYAPVPVGTIAIDRAVFYVADDGTLEHSSSSVTPAEFIAEFERQFTDRHSLEEGCRWITGSAKEPDRRTTRSVTE